MCVCFVLRMILVACADMALWASGLQVTGYSDFSMLQPEAICTHPLPASEAGTDGLRRERDSPQDPSAWAGAWPAWTETGVPGACKPLAHTPPRLRGGRGGGTQSPPWAWADQ